MLFRPVGVLLFNCRVDLYEKRRKGGGATTSRGVCNYSSFLYPSSPFSFFTKWFSTFLRLQSFSLKTKTIPRIVVCCCDTTLKTQFFRVQLLRYRKISSSSDTPPLVCRKKYICFCSLDRKVSINIMEYIPYTTLLYIRGRFMYFGQPKLYLQNSQLSRFKPTQL